MNEAPSVSEKPVESVDLPLDIPDTIGEQASIRMRREDFLAEEEKRLAQESLKKAALDQGTADAAQADKILSEMKPMPVISDRVVDDTSNDSKKVEDGQNKSRRETSQPWYNRWRGIFNKK